MLTSKNLIKKIVSLIFLLIFFLISFFNVSVAQDAGPSVVDYTVTDTGSNTQTPNNSVILTSQNKSYNEGTYEPLAKLPDLGDFNFNDPCPLGRYLNIVINLIIGLIAVMAMVTIVMGGLQYITSELVSGKADGKSKIMNAIFGLLIALSSYLILNTLNPNLLNLCLDGIPKVQFNTDVDDEQPLINGKYGKYTAGAPWNEALAGKIPTLPAGVTVNRSGDCQYVGQRNCTSIRGLNTSIIENVAKNCKDCTLVITGGTENWLHKTHDKGLPIVDLRDTSSLNLYITGKSTPPTKDTTITKNGVKYSYEVAHSNSNTTGAHWHVHY